jgi:trans-aconitate 2-methyltransferase
MLERARAAFPALEFRQADARALTFDREFDAAFTNATLHWIPEASLVIAGVAKALRAGGRFVGEFGGQWNVETIVRGINAARRAAGHREVENPWYNPTLGTWCSLLEAHGFRVAYATHFSRPTPLEGDDGLELWITQFGLLLLNDLDADERLAVVREAVEECRSELWRNGKWYADYWRLRFQAYLTDNRIPYVQTWETGQFCV